MRSLISYLVAASLALHSLLGCCVHHAHAVHADTDHAHATTDCGTCSHAAHDNSADHLAADHDHDAAETEADALASSVEQAESCGHEHGAPCSDSCGEKCQFFATARVQLEKPVAIVDLLPAADVVAGSSVETAWIRCEPWLTAPPALPLRLHLWNGLLLI